MTLVIVLIICIVCIIFGYLIARSLFEWLYNDYMILVSNIIVPIALEVINSFTGNWTSKGIYNKDKSYLFYLITIYLSYIITCGIKTIREKKTENNYLKRIEAYDHEINSLVFETTSIQDLLSHMNSKIKKQTEYLKQNRKIDIREINIDTFATSVCKAIYDSLEKVFEKGTVFTVNIYKKDAYPDKKEYTCMIAHEGRISNPDRLGQPILLKKGSKMHYSDKLFMNNKKDYSILYNKEEVANSFKLKLDKCKYNQYIGVPIGHNNGPVFLLFEIIAHDKSVIVEEKIRKKRLI